MLDLIEDIEDILENAQEVFEVDNETTRRLCCNALMHYFYLPVIKGALTSHALGYNEEQQLAPQYQISPNTALFVLAKTIDMIKFEPFQNCLAIALLGNEGPARIVASGMQCEYGQLADSLLRQRSMTM